MHYKTMALELLTERTELYEELRLTHRLLPSLETWANELKASHEKWKQTLAGAKPGSEPSQLASEALEMALKELAEKHVLELDEERKAAMVSNLLVVLCAESEAQPVINTGTLYT